MLYRFAVRALFLVLVVAGLAGCLIEPVTVPDLWQRPVDEAGPALAKAGLSLGRITYQYGDSDGYIWNTSPAPGTQVQLFSKINVVVTKTITSEPIGISTIEELQQIGNDPAYPLDGHYRLNADLDASATATWNDGAGFVPLGSAATPFAGFFDGQHHEIRELTINPDSGYAGLFAVVGESGAIVRLTLTDGAVSGGKSVGAFAAVNNGALSECRSNNLISVWGPDLLGGIVAENYGHLWRCTAEGAVTDEGKWAWMGIGGMVGINSGLLRDCQATGDVSGNASIGGLVGVCEAGSVIDCSAAGSVIGEGYGIGGLIGRLVCGWDQEDTLILSTILGSHATGATSGEWNVGGLVGQIALCNTVIQQTVEFCYATGAVTGLQYVGGLIGEGSGETVKHCSAWGNVKGESIVGGLVGSHDGTIEECCATGVVTGSETVGGLVGSNTFGTVINCFNAGLVGGLTDQNLMGVIDSCYSTGVSASSTSFYGGLHLSCFWNREPLPSVSAAGTGIDGLDFLAGAKFRWAGWDFRNVWTQQKGLTIPLLRSCSMPPDYPVAPSVSVTVLGEGTVNIHGNDKQPWGLVTLEPVPSPGYRFAGWMGDGLPEDTPVLPYALPVVGLKPRSLQAVFLEDE